VIVRRERRAKAELYPAPDMAAMWAAVRRGGLCSAADRVEVRVRWKLHEYKPIGEGVSRAVHWIMGVPSVPLPSHVGPRVQERQASQDVRQTRWRKRRWCSSLLERVKQWAVRTTARLVDCRRCETLIFDCLLPLTDLQPTATTQPRTAAHTAANSSRFTHLTNTVLSADEQPQQRSTHERDLPIVMATASALAAAPAPSAGC
jgi:hypothetical protein